MIDFTRKSGRYLAASLSLKQACSVEATPTPLSQSSRLPEKKAFDRYKAMMRLGRSRPDQLSSASGGTCARARAETRLLIEWAALLESRDSACGLLIPSYTTAAVCVPCTPDGEVSTVQVLWMKLLGPGFTLFCQLLSGCLECRLMVLDGASCLFAVRYGETLKCPVASSLQSGV